MSGYVKIFLLFVFVCLPATPVGADNSSPITEIINTEQMGVFCSKLFPDMQPDMKIKSDKWFSINSTLLFEVHNDPEYQQQLPVIMREMEKTLDSTMTKEELSGFRKKCENYFDPLLKINPQDLRDDFHNYKKYRTRSRY